jgi:L-amino acid N-acyltransferase YncA
MPDHPPSSLPPAARADFRLAPCTRAQAPEILALFNDAIEHTTALYEYEPRPPAFMPAWFDAKERDALPVLGAFTPGGTLAGFATYGPFRTLPAYRHTVEHSVYVHREHRRRGVARALLAGLIATARAREVRVMIGVIDTANAPSLALHDALGFARAGTLREVGWKFGRWLDVELCQLTLR